MRHSACPIPAPGTTVEVAGGGILPVDGFGTLEVDPDRPGTTATPVKLVAVAYVPRISWKLLSTCKAVEQWGRPLVYYKTKAVWGSRGRSRSCLTSAPARDCFPQ